MLERLTKVLKALGVDFRTFGTAFDIGSRDGKQAIELSMAFPNAQIVAIECNPDTLEQCRRSCAQQANIRLVEKAINSYTGRCTFFAIDTKRTITDWPDGNPGASSLFAAIGDYPAETYVQNKIGVECIRLHDLCRELGIDTIDLIWMDLQGAELIALESADHLIEKVRYIYTEVSHRPLYHGQCLFDEVENFLTSHGFRRVTAIDRTRWQQDAIYENTRTLFDVVMPVDIKESGVAEQSIRSIRMNVRDIRKIFIVGDRDPKLSGATFLNSETLPISKEQCAKSAAPEIAAAYFHQLAKLYFPLTNEDCLENVLAVDPETIFLQPSMFSAQSLPVFNFGDDFSSLHFEHMARLHPSLHRMFAYSGSTGCMPLKRTWLRELHLAVEEHHGMRPFWQCYLEEISAPEHELGASECEIYLSFCLLYHAKELVIRGTPWTYAETLDDIQRGQYQHVRLRGLITENIDLLQRIGSAGLEKT